MNLSVKVVYKDEILFFKIDRFPAKYVGDICCFSTKDYDCLVFCVQNRFGYDYSFLFVTINKKTKDVKQLEYNSNLSGFVNIVKDHDVNNLILFSGGKVNSRTDYDVLIVNLETQTIFTSCLYLFDFTKKGYIRFQSDFETNDDKWNKYYYLDTPITYPVLLPFLLCNCIEGLFWKIWKINDYFIINPEIRIYLDSQSAFSKKVEKITTCSLLNKETIETISEEDLSGLPMELRIKVKKDFSLNSLLSAFNSKYISPIMAKCVPVFCSLDGRVFYCRLFSFEYAYIDLDSKKTRASSALLHLFPMVFKTFYDSLFFDNARSRVVPDKIKYAGMMHTIAISSSFLFSHTFENCLGQPASLCIFSEEVFDTLGYPLVNLTSHYPFDGLSRLYYIGEEQ